MNVAPTVDIHRVAEAIARLFHPHVEIVLHDVPSGRIAQLWNPVSGCRVGDESLIEAEFHTGSSDAEVIGPYEQTGLHGARTTSVSVPVGEGRYFLCINFDRSAIEAAVGMMMSFGAPQVEMPTELFARDWRVRINESIADWCATRSLSARNLDKTGRAQLVKYLDLQGVFETRKAADHVALALGVSRATVYNLRKESTG